jgi:hypothetical protein
MRHLAMALILATVWVATGCSTDRGGTSDQYDSSVGTAQGRPEPTASPSQRPGMNTRDPRDAQYGTHAPLTEPQP